MDTTHRIVGGLGPTKPATPEIQEIVDKIKPQFEERSNGSYETFEAVSYRQQLVAGVMYYAKVKVGNDEYVHVKIFEPLPQTNKPLELVDYQTGKRENDPVEYF